jgi:hypothetical protein
MSKLKDGMTRRDFIRRAAYAAVGTAVGTEALAGQQSKLEKRARVVLVRDVRAVSADGELNAPVIQEMVDTAVSQLLEVGDPAECWKRLVAPSDLVGIKTNVWQNLPTPKAVEAIIKQRLKDAGVPGDRIRMTDRAARKTLSACTALINARPVRSHHWAGIGGCIKNHIMFAPHPSALHPNSCADLASVWDLPAVKGKTRLNILVALTPLYYGRGPHHWDPRYVWPYRGIFVSKDPVAVDALGAHLLQTKRRLHFGGDKPVTPTRHIAAAERRHGLGVSDLKRIDLVRVGWEKDILI